MTKLFEITMATRNEDGSGHAAHLPTFFVKAHTEAEAEIKIRAMFPKELHIYGVITAPNTLSVRFGGAPLAMVPR